MSTVKAMALMLTVAAIGGCAASRPVALPNGSKGYSIDCSGIGLAFADCMNKAAEVCHGPYSIVDRTNEALPFNPVSRTAIVSCGTQ